jgi:hypothetical protein
MSKTPGSPQRIDKQWFRGISPYVGLAVGSANTGTSRVVPSFEGLYVTARDGFVAAHSVGAWLHGF